MKQSATRGEFGVKQDLPRRGSGISTAIEQAALHPSPPNPNPSANTRQVRGRAFQFHNWPQQCPQSQNQPQCQYCNWNARPQFQHIPNQTASARNTSSTPISVNHFQFPHPADAGCLLTSGCARQCDFCCSMDRDQAPAGPRTVATGEAKRNPWGMWSQTGSAPEGQRNFLCDRTSSPSSFTAKS